MNVYVLNLARSPERRVKMERRLESLGIPFQVVEAFDTAFLPRPDLSQYIAEDSEDFAPDRSWSSGTIGCALSHQMCYRDMVARGIERAVVLEDDAILLPGFDAVLRCLDRVMSLDDLVLLFCQSANSLPFAPLSTVQSVRVNGVYGVYYANKRNLHGGVAYALGLDVARSLLDANSPIRFPADVWSMYYKKGGYKNLRVVHPSPIMHDFASDFGTRTPGRMSRKAAALQTAYKIPPIKAISNVVDYLKIRRKFKLVRDPSPYSPETEEGD